MPPTEHRRRWPRIVAIVLGIPAGLVFGLVLLALYNPMRLMFLTSFVVQNPSQTPRRVAMLGVRDRGGVGPLPEIFTKWLPIPVQPRFVDIPPGQSRRFIYDWDDINFCWIAIKDPNGTVRLQETGLGAEGCPLTGERGKCCGKDEDGKVHVLEDENRLLVAPQLHRDVLRERFGL